LPTLDVAIERGDGSLPKSRVMRGLAMLSFDINDAAEPNARLGRVNR
jgi:hypothetical protein